MARGSALLLSLSIGLISVVLYFSVVPPKIKSLPYSFDNPDQVFTPQVLEKVKKVSHIDGDVKIFRNNTIAPETFVFSMEGRDDERLVIYTGMRDGTIRRLSHFDEQKQTYHFEIIARTASVGTNALIPLDQCKNIENYAKCGVPLGLKLNVHNNDSLLICDSYFGLLELDLKTKNLKVLVDEYNGRKMKFVNSVVQSKKSGLIYFTDSSMDYHVDEYHLDVLRMKPTGRLFEFNQKTGKLRLLLENLYFSNGVALNQQETTLFIMETAVGRIRKYYLDGRDNNYPVYLAKDMFCLPDNALITNKGRLWVGCGGILTNFMVFLGKHPYIKDQFSKLPRNLIMLVRKRIGMGAIYNIETGELEDVIYEHKQRFDSVAGIYPFNGRAYVGSFHNSYLARFDLPKHLRDETISQ